MSRLRWVLSVAVVGLTAGCVVPAVAGPSVKVEAPSGQGEFSQPDACRLARAAVRGFIAEVQLHGATPETTENYQVFWDEYFAPRVAQLGEDFEMYAADCPAIAP